MDVNRSPLKDLSNTNLNKLQSVKNGQSPGNQNSPENSKDKLTPDTDKSSEKSSSQQTLTESSSAFSSAVELSCKEDFDTDGSPDYDSACENEISVVGQDLSSQFSVTLLAESLDSVHISTPKLHRFPDSPKCPLLKFKVQEVGYSDTSLEHLSDSEQSLQNTTDFDCSRVSNEGNYKDRLVVEEIPSPCDTSSIQSVSNSAVVYKDCQDSSNFFVQGTADHGIKCVSEENPVSVVQKSSDKEITSQFSISNSSEVLSVQNYSTPQTKSFDEELKTTYIQSSETETVILTNDTNVTADVEQISRSSLITDRILEPDENIVTESHSALEIVLHEQSPSIELVPKSDENSLEFTEVLSGNNRYLETKNVFNICECVEEKLVPSLCLNDNSANGQISRVKEINSHAGNTLSTLVTENGNTLNRFHNLRNQDTVLSNSFVATEELSCKAAGDFCHYSPQSVVKFEEKTFITETVEKLSESATLNLSSETERIKEIKLEESKVNSSLASEETSLQTNNSLHEHNLFTSSAETNKSLKSAINVDENVNSVVAEVSFEVVLEDSEIVENKTGVADQTFEVIEACPTTEIIEQSFEVVETNLFHENIVSELQPNLTLEQVYSSSECPPPKAEEKDIDSNTDQLVNTFKDKVHQVVDDNASTAEKILDSALILNDPLNPNPDSLKDRQEKELIKETNCFNDFISNTEQTCHQLNFDIVEAVDDTPVSKVDSIFNEYESESVTRVQTKLLPNNLKETKHNEFTAEDDFIVRLGDSPLKSEGGIESAEENHIPAAEISEIVSGISESVDIPRSFVTTPFEFKDSESSVLPLKSPDIVNTNNFAKEVFNDYLPNTDTTLSDINSEGKVFEFTQQNCSFKIINSKELISQPAKVEENESSFDSLVQASKELSIIGHISLPIVDIQTLETPTETPIENQSDDTSSVISSVLNNEIRVDKESSCCDAEEVLCVEDSLSFSNQHKTKTTSNATEISPELTIKTEQIILENSCLVIHQSVSDNILSVSETINIEKVNESLNSVPISTLSENYNLPDKVNSSNRLTESELSADQSLIKEVSTISHLSDSTVVNNVEGELVKETLQDPLVANYFTNINNSVVGLQSEVTIDKNLLKNSNCNSVDSDQEVCVTENSFINTSFIGTENKDACGAVITSNISVTSDVITNKNFVEELVTECNPDESNNKVSETEVIPAPNYFEGVEESSVEFRNCIEDFIRQQFYSSLSEFISERIIESQSDKVTSSVITNSVSKIDCSFGDESIADVELDEFKSALNNSGGLEVSLDKKVVLNSGSKTDDLENQDFDADSIEELAFDETLTLEASRICEEILNNSKESGVEEDNCEANMNKTSITTDGIIESSLTKEESYSLFTKMHSNNVNDCENNGKIFLDNSDGRIEQEAETANSTPDVNKSEAGPVTAEEEFRSGQSFQFDFDYLSQQDRKVSKLSALSRQSLYVKFDPLVGQVLSNTEDSNSSLSPENLLVFKTPMKNPVLEGDARLIALTPCGPTDTSVSLFSDFNKSEAGPVTAEDELSGRSNILDSTILENTQMKNPSSEKKPQTPSTSSSAVEKQNTPKSGQRTIISQEVYQKEMQKLQDLMEQMIVQENKYKDEIKSKSDQLEKLERKVEKLQTEDNEKEARTQKEIQKLQKDVQDKTKSYKQLNLVLEEYERTISQMIAQKEEEKKEFENQKEIIIKERDTTMTHLNNMEIAFNDVHQKYERSKTVIEGMKNNEDILKASLQEYEATIQKQEDKYNKLRDHAMAQLEKANQELDLLKRTHETEATKLNAMVKKAEIRIKSLEEALERKVNENAELTQICDELISKVPVQNSFN